MDAGVLKSAQQFCTLMMTGYKKMQGSKGFLPQDESGLPRTLCSGNLNVIKMMLGQKNDPITFLFCDGALLIAVHWTYLPNYPDN